MTSALCADWYEITMAAVYIAAGWEPVAVFELFVRQLPSRRNYLVAAGLADALAYLETWRLTPDELGYLFDQPAMAPLGPAVRERFSRLSFTGQVEAVPEGTIVFANEPILRVTAPIVEAQWLETALLAIVTYQTMVATKAARLVHAAGRPVIEFGSRRAPGLAAGGSAARAAYIGGCIGTSNVEAGRRFGIPIYGTQAHSWIMAFPSEVDAFAAYARVFPERPVLLIDTYAVPRGTERAIAAWRTLGGVRIDSQPLAILARDVRRRLDRAGLSAAKIVASGNLDEYQITELARGKAPIDSYGVGTALVTSDDAPALNSAYKLVAIRQHEQLSPVIKLARAKATYPGAKQVWRRLTPAGRFREDIIGLSDEPRPAWRDIQPLLQTVMKDGRRVAEPERLAVISARVADQLTKLPPALHIVTRRSGYRVRYSEALSRVTRQCRREQR
ncbi:MAG: nicotinate phosphoribosyltransferase [Deltaproteobacteria bacterium]|nr:nicotinate phosphoribosyltransferase [Deltaproteobacteria bacterium]